MTPPAFLETLREQADAEAKRAGHSSVEPLHLAAALLRRNREYFTEQLGAQAPDAVQERLAGGVFATQAPATVDELMGKAAADPDPIVALYALLKTVLGPLTTTTAEQDTAASASAATAEGADASHAQGGADEDPQVVADHLRRYVELVEPDPTVVGRDATVDQLIALLGRHSPTAPCVVAPPGAGKTTVFAALAGRLQESAYDGPLPAQPVVRVKAEAIIADDRGRALRRVIDGIGGKALLVFDDLEVLAALGGTGADVDMLGVVRSTVGREDLRVAVTMAASYLPKLGVHDGELVEELERVDLEPLGEPELAEIAAQRAETLATYHNVTIPSEARAAALEPAPPNAARTHPALLVERLDMACTVAAMRSDRLVRPEDVRGGGQQKVAAFDHAGLIARVQRHVVGQSDAVQRVANRLALTRAKLDLRPDRPDGVFLFVGPTGVGKTALARALCVELFGAEESLIRIDMSEYAHDWALSRLIGPQPGFVGYTEPESWLTTKVRANPHAVVLLDEIEKAHPTIWNAFLQVFDAGRLTDARGHVADFSEAIIIMTSNIGSDAFRTPTLGFTPRDDDSDTERERVQASLEATMAPELLNRIDEIVVFRPLAPDAIHEIAVNEIDAAMARLADRGYATSVTDEAVSVIAETGYDPQYGARHLQRNIERLLLQSLVGHAPGRWEAVADNGAVAWVAR